MYQQSKYNIIKDLGSHWHRPFFEVGVVVITEKEFVLRTR
jgi:hypothetical protein